MTRKTLTTAGTANEARLGPCDLLADVVGCFPTAADGEHKVLECEERDLVERHCCGAGLELGGGRRLGALEFQELHCEQHVVGGYG